jgi:hypothetical protein
LEEESGLAIDSLPSADIITGITVWHRGLTEHGVLVDDVVRLLGGHGEEPLLDRCERF